MQRTYPSFIALGFCVVMAQAAPAQSRFAACRDGAGNIFNATVIVPVESAAKVDGSPLAVGSEVAVFSSDPAYPNLCVGVLVWQGGHGYITVWGDDAQTSAREGLLPGEPMQYRVWDSAASIEYDSPSVQVSYAQGDGQYGDDAVMILAMLNVTAATSAVDGPEAVQLYENYPNPFHDATTIGFGLSRTTRVFIAVYDVLGRRVTTLLAGVLPAGRHRVRWAVHDRPSGIYLCLMQAEGTVLWRTVTVVK